MTAPQPFPHPRRQGAWTVWWLTAITLGVYYLVWYDRIGKELAGMTNNERTTWTRWWSQLIPIYGLVGLSRTAKRLNQAHILLGSTVRVSPFVTWFWATSWFGSHTRYLQRRINTLAEIRDAQRAGEQS
ncbi:hypothetical protein [Nocardia sp. NPDC051570]|uniref:hypothetical protein n=1 Tax=Nocardia sp. NPDC051570 TaxID=3364324 RepID=UPI00378D4386